MVKPETYSQIHEALQFTESCMACDQTFTTVEDMLRHGRVHHNSVDFLSLSQDEQDVATNTFQMYMKGDEGRTFEKHILDGIKLKCKKTCILPSTMNRDPDEVLEHEYFVHSICNRCPKCKIVLPYTFMAFHIKAKCNDYLAAEVYCAERENLRTPER